MRVSGVLLVRASLAACAAAPQVPAEPAPRPEPGGRTTSERAERPPLSFPAGDVSFEIVLGPRVVVSGWTYALEEFAAVVTAGDKPLAGRRATLRPQRLVSYDQVVKVVDILIRGDCLDLTFAGLPFSEPGEAR